MKSPGIVQRHPELWWLVSIAAVVTLGVTVGSSVSGVFRNESSLPATSPDALIDNVAHTTSTGYSGTISTQVDLDLPTALRTVMVAAIPVAGQVLNGQPHTLQYWYGSDTEQRVALRTRTSEQNVFRNGSKLITWDTATQVAQTSTVQSGSPAGGILSAATPLSLTPPQLAGTLLTAAGHDSDTSLRSGDTVAGRQTYELVMRPKDSASSRVDEVQIQVDGEQFVPLGVKVYARGVEKPVVNSTFTSITFTPPAQRNFTFTPPSDSVANTAVQQAPVAADPLVPTLGAVRVRGSGWTSVAVYRSTKAQARVITRVLGATLTDVKGKWGRGKLLSTPTVSLLVTAKGAILAGAVPASVLYAAVG